MKTHECRPQTEYQAETRPCGREHVIGRSDLVNIDHPTKKRCLPGVEENIGVKSELAQCPFPYLP